MVEYIPCEVTVRVDLESPGIVEQIAVLIQLAFIEGANTALTWKPTTIGQPLSIDDIYEDWRAYGPGARLPGGAVFRRELEDERSADLRDMTVLPDIQIKRGNPRPTAAPETNTHPDGTESVNATTQAVCEACDKVLDPGAKIHLTWNDGVVVEQRCDDCYGHWKRQHIAAAYGGFATPKEFDPTDVLGPPRTADWPKRCGSCRCSIHIGDQYYERQYYEPIGVWCPTCWAVIASNGNIIRRPDVPEEEQ